MGASDILNLLRQSSLRVSLSGMALNVLPVERLTDETRTLIRDNKPEILTALAGEAAELTQLVRQCGDAYGFTEAEHIDALAAALADSESALTCFRSIAAELAANDADPAPQVVAIPHPGAADRRLTIASSAGQYQGAECGNCLHLTMTQDLPTPARRRQFQWACKAGFKPLAAGYGSERILIAPDDCGSYLTMEQTGGLQ